MGEPRWNLVDSLIGGDRAESLRRPRWLEFAGHATREERVVRERNPEIYRRFRQCMLGKKPGFVPGAHIAHKIVCVFFPTRQIEKHHNSWSIRWIIKRVLLQ